MVKTLRGHKIDTIFVLIIFCVFAASVLMVLMLGGSIYKNISEISLDGYDERTCLSYIWSKAKNSDEVGQVYVGDFQGLSVLCIDENYGGVVYQTTIYFHDGWVRELFCEAGLEFAPEDGVPVIKTGELKFEQLSNGLIRAVSGTDTLIISPRSQSDISYTEGGGLVE